MSVFDDAKAKISTSTRANEDLRARAGAEIIGESSSTSELIGELEVQLQRSHSHIKDVQQQQSDMISNSSVLLRIDQEMSRQSAQLNKMQLELHRQGADIQAMRRIAAESRMQHQLERQNDQMQAHHQSMQHNLHESLQHHADVQRDQLKNLQEVMNQHGSELQELKEEVDAPSPYAGPTETVQPPIEGGGIKVVKVDFATQGAAGADITAFRTFWMVWSGRDLLVVVGDGVNEPADHSDFPQQLIQYIQAREDAIDRRHPFAIFLPHGRQGTGFLSWFPVLSSAFGAEVPIVLTDEPAFDEFISHLEGPKDDRHKHPIRKSIHYFNGIDTSGSSHSQVVTEALREASQNIQILPSMEITFPSQDKKVEVEHDDDGQVISMYANVSSGQESRAKLLEVSAESQPSTI